MHLSLAGKLLLCAYYVSKRSSVTVLGYSLIFPLVCSIYLLRSLVKKKKKLVLTFGLSGGGKSCRLNRSIFFLL